MDKIAYVRSANLIAGAGLGALLMYLLDRQQGRRRVALARDKVVHLMRVGSELADAGSRDLLNRAAGLVSQARRALRREQPVGPVDDILVERVRARLGRLVSHPHAVRVAVDGGRVILSGPLLQAEEKSLLRGVRAVRGVREVENRLDVHETDDRLPALQGGSGRPLPPLEFMRRNWAPGPRLLAIVAGTALTGFGMTHRSLSGTLLGLAGIGLAARGATNAEFGRLLGTTGGERSREIEIGVVPHDTAARRPGWRAAA